MIERKYVEYELAKGKKDICIVCNCKNAETLNTFLCSDVRPFEEWIKSDFDKVLSGEIISKEISGNVCCAEINFKNTKIYNMLIEDDDEYYEIGYALGKEYWRKGYATESLKAVTEFLIKEVGIRKFLCRYAKENRASGSVIRKVGFEYKGKGKFTSLDGKRNFESEEYYLER